MSLQLTGENKTPLTKTAWNDQADTRSSQNEKQTLRSSTNYTTQQQVTKKSSSMSQQYNQQKVTVFKHKHSISTVGPGSPAKK